MSGRRGVLGALGALEAGIAGGAALGMALGAARALVAGPSPLRIAAGAALAWGSLGAGLGLLAGLVWHAAGRRAAMAGAAPRSGRRAAAHVLLLAAGAALLGLQHAAAPPHLLLVVVDCLRADRLGCYGYPRATSPQIDRLSRRGLLFSEAYAASSWTKPSVASLLTGLAPPGHDVRDLDDALPETLPTLPDALRAAGYRSSFVNGGNTFLGQSFLFHRPFDDFAYQFPPRSARLAEAFAASRERAGAGRLFAYVHVMNAHLPYPPGPENHLFADCPDERLALGAIRVEDLRGHVVPEDLRRRLSDLFDGQIHAADREVGRLLAVGSRMGSLMTAVTGDHGEEMWEHGNVEHGHTLYDEIVRVPLILSEPGLPAAIVSTAASHLDVFATFAAAAGIEPASGGAGLDLLALAREPRTIRLVPIAGTLYGYEKVAVVAAGRKAIVTLTPPGTRLPPAESYFRPRELYDLGGDPRELRDLAPGRPDPLFQAADALSRERPVSGPASQAELPSDELRSLGYVGK